MDAPQFDTLARSLMARTRRRHLPGSLLGFVLALQALLGSRTVDEAAARMGALNGRLGGHHGKKQRRHTYHHRRKRKGKHRRPQDSGVSWVTLNVTNLTADTLDVRGYTACLKTNGEQSVAPGDTREIRSSIYFAAAWINKHYAIIVDRGNDVEMSHGGLWSRKHCYDGGETDLEVGDVEVGRMLDQTIEDFRFVLLREEDGPDDDKRAIYHLSVHDLP